MRGHILALAAVVALSGCSGVISAPVLTVDAEVLLTVPPETVRPALDAVLERESAAFEVHLTPFQEPGVDGARLRLVRTARADVRGLSPVEALVEVVDELRRTDASLGTAYQPRWSDGLSEAEGCPALDQISFARGSDALTPPELVEFAGFELGLAYPSAERVAGIEGVVMLMIIVESDGRPTCVHAVQTPSPGLAAEAAHALRQQSFVAGRVGEVPVRGRVLMPVRFVLN